MLSVSLFQFGLGVALAVIISLVAHRLRLLSTSGAAAASVVGAVVFGLGGWDWAAPMLAFFTTSSGLSRWRRHAKAELGYEKDGCRDAGQVIANGWIAATCVVAFRYGPLNVAASAYSMYLASLAAANADTWATEIGSAVGGKPFLFTSMKRVPAGTSGAVSMPGILGMAAGAALIGLFALAFHPLLSPGDADSVSESAAFIVVFAAGLGGAVLDSVLGATVQAQWRDRDDPQRVVERRIRGERPVRGLTMVNNDFVNFACTAFAVCIAWFLR